MDLLHLDLQVTYADMIIVWFCELVNQKYVIEDEEGVFCTE